MSARELQDHLAASRVRVRAAFDAIPVADRGQRSSPQRWSADEIVAHLALVGRQVFALCRRGWKKAQADGVALAERHEAVLPSMQVPELDRRKHPLQAPAAALPPPELDAAQAWEELDRVQEALRELATEIEGFDVSGVRFPHPLLGAMDLRQWIAFTGLHELRHAEQLVELREQLQA